MEQEDKTACGASATGGPLAHFTFLNRLTALLGGGSNAVTSQRAVKHLMSHHTGTAAPMRTHTSNSGLALAALPPEVLVGTFHSKDRAMTHVNGPQTTRMQTDLYRT